MIILCGNKKDLDEQLQSKGDLTGIENEIIRIQSEIEDLITNSQVVLDARLSGINDQLLELRGLRGKNEDVVEHMMNKVKVDKENFEKGLQRFQALRSIFSQHTNRLFTLLGMESLKWKC